MSKNAPTTLPDVDPLVSSSCLDFLMIELIPLAQRLTEQIQARDKTLIEARKNSQIFSKSLPDRSRNADGRPAAQQTAGGARDSTSVAHDSTAGTVAGMTSVTGAGMDGTGGLMDDDTREATWFRVEQMGYRVGQGLVERFSAGKPRPQTPLDAIKFLCKDLWTLLYKKQIDNLKTNHRGIFVLTDARFHPLSRVSVDLKAGPKAREETLQRAQSYLVFPSGVIRGVLQGLGIECTVVSESGAVPGARFEVRVKGAKP